MQENYKRLIKLSKNKIKNIESTTESFVRMKDLTPEAYEKLRAKGLEQHFKAFGSYPAQTILEMINNSGDSVIINGKTL